MKLAITSPQQWIRFWGDARTRIVLWFVAIIFLFVGLTIPLIRLQIGNQVDARVRTDLNEEMEEFLELLAEGPKLEDEGLIRGLREDGQPVPRGHPRTSKELESILEIHLKRRLPEDDMFLIGFVNGEFFRSSPRALPTILNQDSALMKRWTTLTRFEQGEKNCLTQNMVNCSIARNPSKSTKKSWGSSWLPIPPRESKMRL
jgi:hypothetical protein